MTQNGQRQQMRIACTDCTYLQVIEKGSDQPAKLIIDHGRDTGHTLTVEEIGSK